MGDLQLIGSSLSCLRVWGQEQLRNVFPEYRTKEADWLLAHLLCQNAAYLHAHGDEQLEPELVSLYQNGIERLIKHEPFAYIVCEKEFCSVPFFVDRRVLIPRPETEILVECALSYFSKDSTEWLCLDVGTGSGAIILSVMYHLRERFGDSFLERGRFFGLDISNDALSVASENARRLALDAKIELLQSDLLADVRELHGEALELIIANPPYISQNEILMPEVALYEPEIALRSGHEGVDLIKQLIVQAAPRVKKGAVLLMEIGATQKALVESLLFGAGLEAFEFYKDIQGYDRIVKCGSL